MNNGIMKHIFFVVIACMIAFILWGLSCHGQSVEVMNDKPTVTHALILPGKVALEWQFHGETRVWLEARSADRAAWPLEGYNPSFVSLVSQYRPIVTKRADGRYEVTFASDIATNLP